MNNANRVIVNTAAQYIKTIANLCLSFYSTRLLLSSLGVADYGIYTLIAGVVYLLSFVINALVVTTQRYMSYYCGKGSIEKQKEVFSNSLIIHLVLGFAVAVIVEVIGLFLFDGFLNVSIDRIHAAKMVYHSVVLMLALSFFSAPFRALLISHENIVYVSLIDIIDGILKVLIVLIVAALDVDKLILYAALLCIIQVFEFLAFAIYDSRSYEECIFPRKTYFNKNYVKDISSFAGWTIYSVGCITGRSQGVSIILNKFIGVVANAAYGVALQINGAMSFLSQSLLNALNPQIMKAEGAGERAKMLRLSEIESKFCFLLISMVAVPCIFEMDNLLSLWLTDVPSGAAMFCRFVLIATLIDQLTIGLASANQAIGKIKSYSLTINSIKLLTLVPFALCLYMGCSVFVAMIVYVAAELLGTIMRLFFLKVTAGLSINEFINRVLSRELLPIIVVILTSYFCVTVFSFKYRFLLTIVLSIITMAFTVYYTGLCKDEKEIVYSIIKHVKYERQ